MNSIFQRIDRILEKVGELLDVIVFGSGEWGEKRKNDEKPKRDKLRSESVFLLSEKIAPSDLASIMAIVRFLNPNTLIKWEHHRSFVSDFTSSMIVNIAMKIIVNPTQDDMNSEV